MLVRLIDAINSNFCAMQNVAHGIPIVTKLIIFTAVMGVRVHVLFQIQVYTYKHHTKLGQYSQIASSIQCD